MPLIGLPKKAPCCAACEASWINVVYVEVLFVHSGVCDLEMECTSTATLRQQLPKVAVVCSVSCWEEKTRIK